MPLAKGEPVYFVTTVKDFDKKLGKQTIAMPNMEGTISWVGAGKSGLRYQVFIPQLGAAVFCSPHQINELHRKNGEAFEQPRPGEVIRVDSVGRHPDDLEVDTFAGIRPQNDHPPSNMVDTWERRMSAKIYTLETMEDGEHYRRTLEWIIDGMIARRV